MTPGKAIFRFVFDAIHPRSNKYVLLLAAILVLTLQSLAFGQASNSSQPGGGTRRNFALYGDVKILDETPADTQRPAIFDIILYTRGGDVFSRQRVGSGGRYRFNNIFNGDYYLAIELDSLEIARMPIMIAPNAPDLTRQDLEFKYKSALGGTKPGVIDVYDRSAANKTLYEKSAREISAKNFPEAITTLKSLVAADPKDYPAWTDLGMVYFLQKDLESAESSYTSALGAKADHLQALISLGRVRMARKNFEGAVETLENAVKIDAKSAQANYFLGEAYLQVKKGSKAVGVLNTAIELDPIGMADAHLRLGSLYNLAGYKDRAAAEYEKYLAKKPDYAERKKLEEYIQANKPKTETPKP
jgi:tetratricopeptide (TPR) repeat protein